MSARVLALALCSLLVAVAPALGAGTHISTVAGAETATFDTGGVATAAGLNEPVDVAALPGSGSTWHVYVADSDNCVVRRVALPAGTISVAAGDEEVGCAATSNSHSGQNATDVALGVVTSLAATSDGKLLIGEHVTLKGRVHLLDPSSGTLTTVAGSGTCGAVGSTTASGIAATTAALCIPNGLAAHPTTANRFLIVTFTSPTFNDEVFEVNGTGSTNLKRVATEVNTTCGTTALTWCFSFARDALYTGSGTEFLVSDAAKDWITKFDAADQSLQPVVIAGGGANDPGDGGTATAAKLKGPWGLAPSYDGGYYFADYSYAGDANDGCRIRKAAGFTAASTISTVAGTGGCVSDDGSRIDGVPAEESRVVLPHGIATYPGGLLIAETFGKAPASTLGATSSGRVRQVDRTTILSGPPLLTNALQADFSMAALEPGAALECEFNDANGVIFDSPCANPRTIGVLEGLNQFKFNVAIAPKDPTPATQLWTGDFTLPAPVGLLEPAAAATGVPALPTFSWNASTDANGIARYELWIDGKLNRSGTDTSGTPVGPLAESQHSWFVRAIDNAGNTRESETRTFSSGSPPTAALVASPNPVLVGRPATFDASGSSDANGPIVRYEWDLDGDGTFELDTGTASSTSRAYESARALTVAVRVTDGVGLAATALQELRVTDAGGPTGQLGVTVNNGAQYTRTPDVVVSANFPAATTSLLFSNDGGFLAPQSFAPQRETKWRLDSSGPERLPKIVYVRFMTGPFPSQTFTDDIILDETPPTVQLATLGSGPPARAATAAARKRRWTVRVRARDSNSGVAGLYVTANKRKPGKLLRYRTRVTVRSVKPPRFVRARDRAGNLSRWRTAKRR
jgi:hypothetical protein